MTTPVQLTASHDLKVALIHYWLVGMRGGEKVLEALCRLFPGADIYTHVYDPDSVSETIRRHRVLTTPIQHLPMARRLYRSYLPFMPMALEGLDLSGYDLVISSEAGPAKGVIVPPAARHICYCHSPMRYLWDQYHTYRSGAGAMTRLVMPFLAHRLRQWDVVSAARVDQFLANSAHVASRIERYLRRDATVVHPPVAVDDFAPVSPSEREDYYLWVGELVPYKRADIAVEAFNRLGLPLVVIGGMSTTGAALAAKAKPNVTFLGKAPFDQLRHHLARCRALIFPGEEDFGIVPVEAMASGRPIVAYGRGGILDTVRDRETGLLFHDQSADGLIAAIEEFERSGLSDVDPAKLVQHARKFDERTFQIGILNALSSVGVTATADAVSPLATI